MVYANKSDDVDDLTEKQAKEQLKYLLDKLNDLSKDDFFGTEGWERFFSLDE